MNPQSLTSQPKKMSQGCTIAAQSESFSLLDFRLQSSKKKQALLSILSYILCLTKILAQFYKSFIYQNTAIGMKYSSILSSFALFLLCLAQEISALSRESKSTGQQDNDPIVCEGNRFKFISAYSLGKQTDLNLTFNQMSNATKIDRITYKDQLFRTYTIFDIELYYRYDQISQTAKPIGSDQLKISGGSLRFQYKFKWQKKQLSNFIQGNGTGAVRADPISFIKELKINNETKLFEWNFISAEVINVTNSLTLQSFYPYKDTDYKIISQMLNQLQDNMKKNIISSVNVNYSTILKKIVHQNNDTWREPKNIYYTYSDYHGQFSLVYENVLLNSSIVQGLQLLLSQVIQGDSKFDCGDKVPMAPLDEKIYGGLQQYISNSYLKSSLRNALNKKFFDVLLTQQFWQSPAFQFYIGDVHQVMPSTKNISSLEPISGKCQALEDKYFNLVRKTATTYLASVNFTCDLRIYEEKKRLLGMDIAVNYQIQVTALTSSLRFTIKDITGVPTFFEEEDFKIKNMDLALYMIQETLKMAKKATVIGTGLKTMSRKSPKAQVKQKYLFIYDASAKIDPSLAQKCLENGKTQSCS